MWDKNAQKTCRLGWSPFFEKTLDGGVLRGCIYKYTRVHSMNRPAEPEFALGLQPLGNSVALVAMVPFRGDGSRVAAILYRDDPAPACRGNALRVKKLWRSLT